MTYEEFKILTYIKWCEALENEDAEFDKAFAVLDVDGSGKLDPVEFKYSKTCAKRPLSKRPKIVFKTQLSLNAGQRYCRMLQVEHSA